VAFPIADIDLFPPLVAWIEDVTELIAADLVVV